MTLSASQSVRDISWSPDGSEIAFIADNDGVTVRVLPGAAMGGAVRRYDRDGASRVRCISARTPPSRRTSSSPARPER